MAQFSNYFPTKFNVDANSQEEMEMDFKTEVPDDDTTRGAYDHLRELDEGLVEEDQIIKGGGGDWSDNDGEEEGVTLKQLLRRVKMLEEQQMVVGVGVDLENQDLVHQLYAKCKSLEARFNKWRLEVNKRLRLLDGRKANGTTVARGRKRKGSNARIHEEVSALDGGGSTGGKHYESQHQVPPPTSASSSRKSQTSLKATDNSREYRPRSRSRPRYSVENSSSTPDVSPVSACPTCSQAFTSKASQQSHTARDCARKIRARENYIRALERNACSICSRGFTSLATLKDHEKRDHGRLISKYDRTKPTKRPIRLAPQKRRKPSRPSSSKSGDDYEEGNLKDFPPHGTQRSRGPDVTEAEPHTSVTPVSTKLLCPEEGCGCLFSTSNLLERHLTFCRLPSRYKCPHCEKSFAFKTKLYLHQMGAHPHPPAAGTEQTETGKEICSDLERTE